MKKTLLLPNLLFVLLLNSLGCSTLSVTKVTDANKDGLSGGLYYTLPRTIVTVEVPITKITRTRGHCFDRDPQISRSRKKVIEALKGRETVELYSMGDINITSYPVPDPSKIFFVKMNKHLLKSQNLATSLSELGLLTSAEMTIEDRTFDIIVQSANAIVGIATTVSSGFKQAEDLKLDNTDSLVEKEKKEKDECELMLQELNTIRSHKRTLLSGQGAVVASEGILNRQLSELNKLEEALLSEFSYSEEKQTHIVKIDVAINDGDSSTSIDLFRFTETEGLIVQSTTPGGYLNKYPDYISKRVSATVATHQLVFTKPTEQVVNKTSKEQLGDKMGLAYNIPAKVNVYVQEKDDKKGNRVIATANVLLPQMGNVSFLSKKLSKVAVELDPATGALRKVTSESKGLTTDQIKGLGGALDSTAGLFNKKTYKLSQLESQRKMLEEQQKILKLEQSIDSLLQQKAPVAN